MQNYTFLNGEKACEETFWARTWKNFFSMIFIVIFWETKSLEASNNFLCKVNFFPAKIPFFKIQKNNLAGKNYFANERGSKSFTQKLIFY
jgi:hypothetical protein